MTQKDYVKIAKDIRIAQEAHCAKVIQSVLPSAFEAFVDCIIGNLANTFAEDNPRFDRKRFYRACEPEGGENS